MLLISRSNWDLLRFRTHLKPNSVSRRKACCLFPLICTANCNTVTIFMTCEWCNKMLASACFEHEFEGRRNGHHCTFRTQDREQDLRISVVFWSVTGRKVTLHPGDHCILRFWAVMHWRVLLGVFFPFVLKCLMVITPEIRDPIEELSVLEDLKS